MDVFRVRLNAFLLDGCSGFRTIRTTRTTRTTSMFIVLIFALSASADTGDADEGLRLYEHKKFTAAAPYLRRAVKEQPGRIDCHLALGMTSLKCNDYDRAVVEFDACRKLDPHIKIRHDKLAEAYAGVHRMPEAIEEYGKEIAQNSNDGSLYHERGHLYFAIDDYPQALADYDHAIKLNPRDDRCYKDRARLYVELKNYSKAIDDYGVSLKLAPLISSYFARGNCYMHLSKFKEAAEEYSGGIKLNSHNPEGYLLRAKAWESCGQADRAAQDRKTAHDKGVDLL